MAKNRAPDNLSDIPEGAVARVEVTIMEGGHMSVNIFPNEPEHMAAVLVAALDMWGYDVKATRRASGLPSSAISDLESREHVPMVSWSDSDIAMG